MGMCSVFFLGKTSLPGQLSLGATGQNGMDPVLVSVGQPLLFTGPDLSASVES